MTGEERPDPWKLTRYHSVGGQVCVWAVSAAAEELSPALDEQDQAAPFSCPVCVAERHARRGVLRRLLSKCCLAPTYQHAIK
jgi:hypothetical protein